MSSCPVFWTGGKLNLPTIRPTSGLYRRISDTSIYEHGLQIKLLLLKFICFNYPAIAKVPEYHTGHQVLIIKLITERLLLGVNNN